MRWLCRSGRRARDLAVDFVTHRFADRHDALIDDAVPVIVLAPSGPLFEKTVSNMQEVQARGGKVVLISDAEGIALAGEGCLATIEMPKVHPLIAPLVYAVPVQLLAYHVAVVKGTDVDQPRNLAKSVTVE